MSSTISAYDFATAQPVGSSAYAFGTNDTAKALRALADRIDVGQINVEKVNVTTIARGDKFTETALVMRFEEKIHA